MVDMVNMNHVSSGKFRIQSPSKVIYDVNPDLNRDGVTYNSGVRYKTVRFQIQNMFMFILESKKNLFN